MFMCGCVHMCVGVGICELISVCVCICMQKGGCGTLSQGKCECVHDMDLPGGEKRQEVIEGPGMQTCQEIKRGGIRAKTQSWAGAGEKRCPNPLSPPQ